MGGADWRLVLEQKISEGNEVKEISNAVAKVGLRGRKDPGVLKVTKLRLKASQEEGQ